MPQRVRASALKPKTHAGPCRTIIWVPPIIISEGPLFVPQTREPPPERVEHSFVSKSKVSPFPPLEEQPPLEGLEDLETLAEPATPARYEPMSQLSPAEAEAFTAPGLAGLAERATRAGGLFSPEHLAAGTATPVEDSYPRVRFARKGEQLWIRIEVDKFNVIERPSMGGDRYAYPLAYFRRGHFRRRESALRTRRRSLFIIASFPSSPPTVIRSSVFPRRT